VLGDSIAQNAAQHMLADQRRRAVAAAPRAPSSAPSPSPAPPSLAPWRYDWLRTARLCAYSALLGSPIAHYWFGLLDRGTLLPASVAAAPRAAAALKTALDQLLMAPLGLSLFFCSVSLMEGKGPAEAAASLSARIKPALQANYLLWPAAQIVNFSFVPPQQRVLYVNCVAVFWCAILSHLAAAEVGGAEGAGASKGAGEGEGEGQARRRRSHLPLPVPASAEAGPRRRDARAGGQPQGKQQKRRRQQDEAGEQPPPDTFVPVVP